MSHLPFRNRIAWALGTKWFDTGLCASRGNPRAIIQQFVRKKYVANKRYIYKGFSKLEKYCLCYLLKIQWYYLFIISQVQ